MRADDPFQNPLLGHVVNFFGGGGGSSKPPKQKYSPPPVMPPPPAAPVALPKMPEPVKPDPPVTTSAIDVEQARQQQVDDAKKRKGIQKTLIAGEANQAPATPMGGKKTLLG